MLSSVGSIKMNEPTPTTKLKEDPMKTLIREVIAEGRKRLEFKKSVKKHLIKTGTGNRQAISIRIKEAHKRINAYWKQIEAEKVESNGKG